MIRHSVQLRTEDGTAFDRWKSYRVSTDYRTLPSTTWRLTFGPATSDATGRVTSMLRDAGTATVIVDGVTMSTGRIVDIERGGSRDDRGSYVNVSGTDPTGQAAQASLPLGFAAHGAQTFTDLIRAALSPWSIPIVTSNALNREAITRRRVQPRAPENPVDAAAAAAAARILVQQGTTAATTARSEPTVVETAASRELHAKPGEKVLEWIRRVAEAEHLVVWCTASGALFVGRPNYDQVPALGIRRGGVVGEGTIQQSALVERYDGPTSVTVCGRLGRTGETPVRAIDVDEALVASGWYCPQVEHDDDLRDLGEAQRRARTLLRAAQMDAWTYTFTLAGHGVGPRMPAPDTLLEICDPVCGLAAGTLGYVVAREFTTDRSGGAILNGTAVAPGLWGVE